MLARAGIVERRISLTKGFLMALNDAQGGQFGILRSAVPSTSARDCGYHETEHQRFKIVWRDLEFTSYRTTRDAFVTQRSEYLAQHLGVLTRDTVGLILAIAKLRHFNAQCPVVPFAYEV